MRDADRIAGHHTPVVSGADAVLIAAYAALSVAIAAHVGQDLNWDLLNYHFYNAYMLIEGRIARDVHAAGVQTFLNPTVDMPFYAAVVAGTPPRVFFLSLAAIHGLALFIVHRLTVLLLPAVPARAAMAAGGVAAVTAAFGAGFVSEAGNTMHDNTLAVPVLGSLWWLAARLRASGPLPAGTVMAAGVVAGAAAGLKLAFGVFAIGLCAAVFVVPAPWRARVRGCFTGAAGVGLGVLLTGGFWMWVMSWQFGSPLFPFMNRLMGSPFAPLSNFADLRFMPRDTMQWIFYPFYWLSPQGLVTEPLMRDGRMAAGMMALCSLALAGGLRRVAGEPPDTSIQARRLMLVATYWLVAYVVWLRLFSVYRYIIPLEMLSGILVVAVLARLAPPWPRHLALSFTVCLALSLGVTVPNWGRTPWSDSYFGVNTSRLERYAGATILMWDFPQGYLPPLFPRSATFVRILTNWGMTEEDLMFQRARESIRAAPDGRLFLLDLEPGSIHEQQPATLARLGLERIGDACESHASHSGGFRLCLVRPQPR